MVSGQIDTCITMANRQIEWRQSTNFNTIKDGVWLGTVFRAYNLLTATPMMSSSRDICFHTPSGNQTKL